MATLTRQHRETPDGETLRIDGQSVVPADLAVFLVGAACAENPGAPFIVEQPAEPSLKLLARYLVLQELTQLRPGLLLVGVGDQQGRFRQGETRTELARVLVEADDPAFIAHLGRFVGDGGGDPDPWVAWENVAAAQAALAAASRAAQALVSGDIRPNAPDHASTVAREMERLQAHDGATYVDDAGQERTVDLGELRKALSDPSPATVAALHGNVDWILSRLRPRQPRAPSRRPGQEGRIYRALARRMEAAT